MTDGEAPSQDRSAYEQAALDFVRLVIAGRAREAYEQMSDEGRNRQPFGEFTSFVEQIAKELPGGLEDLHVEHSYQVALSAAGTAEALTVICSRATNGSIADAATLVSMRAAPINQQAYAIIEGRARNNDWAFTLWLPARSGKWRVGAVHAAVASILHRSSEKLWADAREQKQRGHIFNAYVLYHAALETADRGPNLRLGIWSAIDGERKSLTPPPDLKGQQPFRWSIGDRTFQIESVEMTGIADEFILVLRQDLAQWGDESYLDGENRALLAALNTTHPEYKDFFGAVMVEAVQPGRSGGYRTVEDLHKPAN